MLGLMPWMVLRSMGGAVSETILNRMVVVLSPAKGLRPVRHS